MFPAFIIQQTLRRGIVGESFWRKVEREREEVWRDKSIFDIMLKVSDLRDESRSEAFDANLGM